jgi:predicted nucleic acid-binding protein
MSYLIDTNVLLRLRDSADPRYTKSIAAIELLTGQSERLFVCAQILAEFWVVLTRPCDVNGCGLAFDDAITAIGKVRGSFRCLAEPPDIADRWQQVIIDNKVMGKQAHDARIAALMLAQGITHILTLNPGDFTRYEGITSVTPQELVHQFAT